MGCTYPVPRDRDVTGRRRAAVRQRGRARARARPQPRARRRRRGDLLRGPRRRDGLPHRPELTAEKFLAVEGPASTHGRPRARLGGRQGEISAAATSSEGPRHAHGARRGRGPPAPRARGSDGGSGAGGPRRARPRRVRRPRSRARRSRRARRRPHPPGRSGARLHGPVALRRARRAAAEPQPQAQSQGAAGSRPGPRGATPAVRTPESETECALAEIWRRVLGPAASGSTTTSSSSAAIRCRDRDHRRGGARARRRPRRIAVLRETLEMLAAVRRPPGPDRAGRAAAGARAEIAPGVAAIETFFFGPGNDLYGALRGGRAGPMEPPC